MHRVLDSRLLRLHRGLGGRSDLDQRHATSQAIAQVGTISANGDAAIGETIAKAMEHVGESGVL